MQFDPDVALNSAMRLFWQQGYEATSLQNLLDTMQLSRSSFYQTFKSKPELFQESIRQYRKLSLQRFSTNLKQADSAREFIETLFYDVADETCGPNARRGCLLLNTANEFAQTDPHIAGLIDSSLKQIIATLEQAIIQAQQEKQIPADKDAALLAHYLMSSMSGLKNMVKAGADRAAITKIAGLMLTVLD